MSSAWSTRGSAAEDARVVILAAAGRRRLGSGANRSTKWSFDGSRTLSVPAWMTRSMVLGLIDALTLTDGSSSSAGFSKISVKEGAS